MYTSKVKEKIDRQPSIVFLDLQRLAYSYPVNVHCLRRNCHKSPFFLSLEEQWSGEHDTCHPEQHLLTTDALQLALLSQLAEILPLSQAQHVSISLQRNICGLWFPPSSHVSSAHSKYYKATQKHETHDVSEGHDGVHTTPTRLQLLRLWS